MARRMKGSVYRKSKAVTKGGKTKRVKKGGWRVGYTDATGKRQDYVLRLPNGNRVTDKSVAESLLNEILRREERKGAGIIDPIVEAATMPIRVPIARFIRHLRGKRRNRGHIRANLTYLLRVMEFGGIERVADFRTDAVDRALARVSDMGRGARTISYYRSAAHGLAEWAIRAELMNRNPVALVDRRDEKADRRHRRRAMTMDEAHRLLSVAGPRKLFYATAIWTGIRVNELAHLEWRDVDLDGDRPVVRIRAEIAKAKRHDELPLHADLVVMLKQAKPPFATSNDRIFESVPRLQTLVGRWYKDHKDDRKYQLGDLDRAQIAGEDVQGRCVDRHAFKTTFGTWLAVCGVPEQARRKLTRHAARGITEVHYTDLALFDLWAEIAKLPPIRTEPGGERLRATGTDDARVSRQVQLTFVRKGVNLSAIGQHVSGGGTDDGPKKTMKIGVSGPSGTCDDVKRKRENMTGRQVRELCRSGAFDAPTAGVAGGYVQANLVVLKAAAAGSFETFCRLNIGPCPLIEITGKSQHEPCKTAPGADLRTDLPRYRVYREGALVDRPTDVTSHWTHDCVAFLIGCSFTFEAALQCAGLPVRHIEQGRNVPMYRTDRACRPAGVFNGPLVVSMRPMTLEQAAQAQAVTARFTQAHGPPVHIGDPSALGISDLSRPDYGDPVTIHGDEVPVFWACGVTPIEAIMRAKPVLAITHEPGHMFVTDLRNANPPKSLSQ